MNIRLNGAERETAARTIASLIDELRLPRQTVLVECNGQALRREQWEAETLQAGDAVEVLQVAAGG